MSKVSIIIPNWNGYEKLKRNLPNVLKVKGFEEIIIVDDFSTDESVKLIETEFPQIKLIKKDKNQGFSSTVNQGVKEAASEYVFLLNTDASPKIDCLRSPLKILEDEKVFSVGADTGEGNWNWCKFENGFLWHYKVSGKPTKHQTLWASGGSGVFRKKVWEKLGGLDEIYNPFYWEDVDLGYRATKRGYINIFDPDFKVEHYKQKGVIAENFSQSRIQKTSARNHLIFIWKNITSPDFISSHLWFLTKILLTSPKYWIVFLSALRHLPAALKKRSQEKNFGKLTDEEIVNKYIG